MIKADLHNHTRYSDGTSTVAEVVNAAYDKGLDAIAITDHDTVLHFSAINDDMPIKVIPGVELSCYDYNVNVRVHMLGYCIQNVDMIAEFTQPLRKARHEKCLRQIDVLKKHGFDIDASKIDRTEGECIYKQHIMEYLMKTGQADDLFGDFYKSVFKNGGICDFDITYFNPIEAVKVIREAGGFAVLAHSGQQQNFALIPELYRAGLSGLELNHHSNSERDKEIIRDYASRYGLFMTGGSDSHGYYEAYSVGDYISHESGVRAILGIE